MGTLRCGSDERAKVLFFSIGRADVGNLHKKFLKNYFNWARFLKIIVQKTLNIAIYY